MQRYSCAAWLHADKNTYFLSYIAALFVLHTLRLRRKRNKRKMQFACSPAPLTCISPLTLSLAFLCRLAVVCLQLRPLRFAASHTNHKAVAACRNTCHIWNTHEHTHTWQRQVMHKRAGTTSAAGGIKAA